MDNVAIFSTSSQLVTWLSGLTHLEGEFNSYFGRIKVHLAVNISRGIQGLLVGYFFIPSVLWLVSLYLSFLPKVSFSTSLQVLGNAWFFTYMYVQFCEPFLEDVKVFAMLHCLRLAYKRFREAMGQDLVVRNGGITGNNVAFWLKYATALRRQVDQTGEYLKTHILLSATETITGTSVGIYLILRFSQSEQLEQSLSFILIYVFYCGHHIFRLYVKALLAEGIYSEVSLPFLLITWLERRKAAAGFLVNKQETQLYENVIDMEQDLEDRIPRAVMDKVSCFWLGNGWKVCICVSPQLLLQIRNLRMYLRENPAQLSLGKYLVLNKSFLIQVCPAPILLLSY